MIKIIRFLGLILGLWVLGFGLYVVVIITYTPQASTEKTDGLVVFTGHRGDRIREGLSLFAGGLAPELLISGVHENVSKNEIIQTFQGQNTLPRCCLTIGYEARSTIENATETRAWVADKHIKTVRLVTSDYHMNRALIELHHTLPDIKIISHAVKHPARTLDHPEFWVIAFEEYHKSLFRWTHLIFDTPAPVYHHNSTAGAH